mgnify:FL=1|jgi:hypothetical protein|tara:strand:+ start:1364 stop:1618 length:255 start_codon:yes stop_codon:yes gene_type:complete
MYRLTDKFQDNNNNWVYVFITDEDSKPGSITSKNELTEDELNNFITDYIFKSECNIDYSDFCESLKNSIEYYDRFEYLKEEFRG